MADDDEDYSVGYRKPPRHSQFKPGQSGNPKGRTKGSRGLKTDLTAVLSVKQTIPTKKGDLSGTRQFLMLATLATRAAHGDLKAQALLIPLIMQVLGVEDRSIGEQALPPLDQAIFDHILGRNGISLAAFAGEKGKEASNPDCGKADLGEGEGNG